MLEISSRLIDLFSKVNTQNVLKDFQIVNADALYIEYVCSKLPTDTNMNMNYVWSLYAKSFEASKKNNLQLAEYYLSKAEQLNLSTPLSAEVRKYANIYITPKISYYHYKKGNYEEAHRLTWLALMQTEAIEQEFPNMHMGKVQQVHNIVRLFMRQGQFEQAFQTSTSMLSYLMLGVQPNFPFGTWNKTLLADCSKELVVMMTAQIFLEDIYKVLGLNLDKKQFFVQHYAQLIGFVPSFEKDQAYVSWLNSVSNFYDGNVEGFLSHTELLFLLNTTEFDVLRYFNVLLFLEFLLINGEMRQLDAIVKLTKEKLYLPKELFELLKNYDYGHV